MQSIEDILHRKDLKVKVDEYGRSYINVYSQGLGTEKFFINNFRKIVDPKMYGLEETEEVQYVLYFDYDSNDIRLFEVNSYGGIGKEVERFKEKLLDGELIK